MKRKTPANAGTRRHGELPHTKMRQRRESAPGSYAVVSCSNCEVKARRHFPGPGQAPRTPKVVKTPVAYDGQRRFLRSPKGFFLGATTTCCSCALVLGCGFAFGASHCLHDTRRVHMPWRAFVSDTIKVGTFNFHSIRGFLWPPTIAIPNAASPFGSLCRTIVARGSIGLSGETWAASLAACSIASISSLQPAWSKGHTTIGWRSNMSRADDNCA